MAEQRTSDTPEGFLLHPDRTREIACGAFSKANSGLDPVPVGVAASAARDALVRAGYELAIERLRAGLETPKALAPVEGEY